MKPYDHSRVSNEIIAVITAAIAVMNTRPGTRLQVKNIKRLPPSYPVWNTAARTERLGKFNHF